MFVKMILFASEWLKSNFSKQKLPNNTRKRCEICSELSIKTAERCHYCHSGIFIANFEHISHHCSVCIVDFKHIFFWWVTDDCRYLFA